MGLHVLARFWAFYRNSLHHACLPPLLPVTTCATAVCILPYHACCVSGRFPLLPPFSFCYLLISSSTLYLCLVVLCHDLNLHFIYHATISLPHHTYLRYPYPCIHCLCGYLPTPPPAGGSRYYLLRGLTYSCPVRVLITCYITTTPLHLPDV